LVAEELHPIVTVLPENAAEAVAVVVEESIEAKQPLMVLNFKDLYVSPVVPWTVTNSAPGNHTRPVVTVVTTLIKTPHLLINVNTLGEITLLA
jgi:hypothetical protein